MNVGVLKPLEMRWLILIGQLVPLLVSQIAGDLELGLA